METAQGIRKDLEHGNSGVTKSEKLEEIGITEKQKQRFETLANSEAFLTTFLTTILTTFCLNNTCN